MAKRTNHTRTINLALQGGGAHGAFTWGVLDRLLEDGRIAIEGISGTSAGAINAAVLADGFEKGGRDRARQALDDFWHTLSSESSLNPFSSTWVPPVMQAFSPVPLWFETMSLLASPYQFNPLDFNPLRNLLAKTIDFDCLNHCRGIKLFISATNVQTNRLRIFTLPEVSIEVLLASGCLPQVFQAVEVNGSYYWDGGFMGNPTLEPLVGRCEAPDILIVQINPTARHRLPRTVNEINDRVNEITFNASLMREIRAIAQSTRLADEGKVQDSRYTDTYFHHLPAGDLFEGMDMHSKFDTSWAFLTRLRDEGRERAGQWLTEHFDAIGKGSTLDLSAWYPVGVEGE